MALTPKQQRFVDEYLIDLNASQAAIRAGYSRKTAGSQAHDLLKKPEIAAAVQAAQAARAASTGITKDSVLRRLDEVANRCMTAVPVMEFDHFARAMCQKTAVNDQGQQVGVYEFDSAGANRALELIGKHLGMFIQKHEHTGADGAPIQVISGVPASPEA